MVKALDDLPGKCDNCGEGPVVIDSDGADLFWSYCDQCGHCDCQASSPDEVLNIWKDKIMKK